MEQGLNYLYCKNLNGSSSSDDDESKKQKRKRSKSKYDKDKDESVSLSSSGGEDMVYLSTKQERISKESSPRSHQSSNDDEDIESINIAVCPKSNKKKARESIASLKAAENFHRILPLNVLEKYQQVLGTKKRARLRCKLCHEKTSFFCVKCTNGNYDDIFAICSPLKVPLCDCFYEHVTPVIVTATQTVTIGSSPLSGTYNSYFSPILYDPRVTGWIDQEYLEKPVAMQR